MCMGVQESPSEEDSWKLRPDEGLFEAVGWGLRPDSIGLKLDNLLSQSSQLPNEGSTHPSLVHLPINCP